MTRFIKVLKFRSKLLSATLAGWSTLSFAITSTDVLPKGVRAGAFVYGTGDGIDSNINASGRLESLVGPLNRTLTFDDLASYAPELKDLQKALNMLGPDHLGDNLVSANLYSNISVREQQYVAALLWGVTESQSLGIRIPYIRRSYTAGFHATITNNAALVNQAIGGMPEFPAYLVELQKRLGDPAVFNQYIFGDRGLQVPHGFDATGLGTVELEHRFRFLTSDYFVSALRTNVKLPTDSHEPDFANILDRRLGDHVYSVRMGPVLDFRLWPNVLTFRGGIFGTWRAPSKQTLAIPQPNAPLPNLLKSNSDGTAREPDIETVSKQMGAGVDVDLGLMVDFWKGALSFSFSYDYSAKGPDIFAGNRGLDYAFLMQGTDSESHALEFSAEISTVPYFVANVLPVPAKVVISWFQPIGGRNTMYTPYGRFDVVLLF